MSLFSCKPKSAAEGEIFKGVDTFYEHAPLNLTESYPCTYETTQVSGLTGKRGRKKNVGLIEKGRKSKGWTKMKREHLSKKML